ncbi:MAG: Cu(I)-responsive transcriptional regulator [Alphaproteobacteria bacterium]|nr:Cu(I)-responsive transcriptional regulator [Alphaproteobacteria bacterium]
MNIGRAAEESGVTPKTIRYYESIGLIRPAERRANNYRDYSTVDVETLRFIQRGRSLGFAMKEIADLLALWRDKRRASHRVKAVAERHIAGIDRRMEELAAMRRTLSQLMRLCHGDARPECPILDDLAGKSSTQARRRSGAQTDAA